MNDQTKADIFVFGGLSAILLGLLSMQIFDSYPKVRKLPIPNSPPAQKFERVDSNYKPKIAFYVQDEKIYRDPATMPEYFREKRK